MPRRDPRRLPALRALVVKKQLAAASNTVEDTGRRTRAMERRLRQVEELSPDLAMTVLGLNGRRAGGAGSSGAEEEEPEEYPPSALAP